MSDEDLSYYRQRFHREVALEGLAESVEAAAAHRALAASYAAKVRRLAPVPPWTRTVPTRAELQDGLQDIPSAITA